MRSISFYSSINFQPQNLFWEGLLHPFLGIQNTIIMWNLPWGYCDPLLMGNFLDMTLLCQMNLLRDFLLCQMNLLWDFLSLSTPKVAKFANGKILIMHCSGSEIKISVMFIYLKQLRLSWNHLFQEWYICKYRYKSLLTIQYDMIINVM